MATQAHREFLSVAEAAEQLGVSTRTAYRLVEDEGLPVVKLLGTLRVPAAALKEWIAQQERRALGVTG